MKMPAEKQICRFGRNGESRFRVMRNSHCKVGCFVFQGKGLFYIGASAPVIVNADNIYAFATLIEDCGAVDQKLDAKALQVKEKKFPGKRVFLKAIMVMISQGDKNRAARGNPFYPFCKLTDMIFFVDNIPRDNEEIRSFFL